MKLNRDRIAKAQPKRAPIRSTAGPGYDFEDLIATRFLLDMLGASPALGSTDFGPVTRIDWQVRDIGWLADDLAVTMTTPKGIRVAGVSAKSGQSVTQNGFPKEFATAVWQQWLKDDPSLLRNTANVAVLITGKGNRDLRYDWSDLLKQLTAGDPQRLVKRLADTPEDGNQASAFQRQTFSSFAPSSQSAKKCPAPQEETIELLAKVRWLDFDYQTSESQDYGEALSLCQSVLSAIDASKAKDLWDKLGNLAQAQRHAGGKIELHQLLTELQPAFQIKTHPIYDADWKRLAKRGEQEKIDIRTTINDSVCLPREGDVGALEKSLSAASCCLLTGDSGCGKSAIVKTFSERKYTEIIWLNAATLEFESYHDFVQAVGLQHELPDMIRAQTGSTLFVFDGFEGLTDKSRKLAKQILKILSNHLSAKLHILITAQTDAASATMQELMDCGISISTPTIMSRPADADIRQLVADIPTMKWVGMRPELRSLLTNLKMLDWFTRSIKNSAAIGDGVGLTDLIDSIWSHFVETGDHKYEISHLLIQVAELEAENNTDGIPRKLLGHPEQATLRHVEGRDLVRIRDEKVRFFHDLLGDWARLRGLLADESWLGDAPKRERLGVLRWYRAVRLYGQYRLEQSDDGIARWQAALNQVSDGTASGRAVADLFLDSLFLAPDAQILMEKAWPVLTSNGAAFLRTLLKRFMYVATVPNFPLLALAGSLSDADDLAPLFRLPLWTYWNPVIQVLHNHKDEAVRLVPRSLAEVCEMYLKNHQQAADPGFYFPSRREAAELAILVARAYQLREELGPYGG